MTIAEKAEIVQAVLDAMANNIRCVRCGWIGPEEKLYPSGCLARLTCPQCKDSYHWDRAPKGRWWKPEDSVITCDPEKGCGDGHVYCSRRIAYMKSLGLDGYGRPLSKPPKKLNVWRRLWA